MGFTPICVPSESMSRTWLAVILLLMRVVSRFWLLKLPLNLLIALLWSPWGIGVLGPEGQEYQLGPASVKDSPSERA